MCPLRLILIFLSATLAAYFVIRNLNSPSPNNNDNHNNKDLQRQNHFSSKVRLGVAWRFWTCVDMATGRFLWRYFSNLTLHIFQLKGLPVSLLSKKENTNGRIRSR
ncbi:hypothetical protein ACFE04_016067 [Oxalis oulophora]